MPDASLWAHQEGPDMFLTALRPVVVLLGLVYGLDRRARRTARSDR